MSQIRVANESGRSSPSSMLNALRATLAAGFFVIAAAVAGADVVHLKDGRKVEGEVIQNDAQKVVVKTKFGTSEFKPSEVDKIEAKKTPLQEFTDRRAKIDATDANALFELYLFAKTANLKTESKQVLRDIIKADPEHAAAREALGYVKYKDKWVSEAEAKKLQQADLEAEMKAKGLVLHKGEWIEPAEKEKREHEERGEILVDGKWVNKRELERIEAENKLRTEMDEHRRNGEYLVNGKWVAKAEAEKFYANLETPYRVISDHVILMTNKGIDLGDRVSVEAEAAYRDCKAFFGVEPESKGKKFPVYVTATLEEMNQMAQALGADEKSSGYHAWCTQWLTAHPDGYDMVSATMFYKDTVTDIYARHAVAEQYLNRVVGAEATDVPPRWFIDGFACYIERWGNPNHFKWSRDYLKSMGALSKLKTFLGNYPLSEQGVLQAGLVIAYVHSPNATPEVKKAFDDAVTAIKERGKVGKAFRALQKALEGAESAFLDYAETATG